MKSIFYPSEDGVLATQEWVKKLLSSAEQDSFRVGTDDRDYLEFVYQGYVNVVNHDMQYTIYFPLENGTLATQEWVEGKNYIVQGSDIHIESKADSNTYTDTTSSGFTSVTRGNGKTRYTAGEIEVTAEGSNTTYSLTLPKKEGTIAITSDIPQLYEHNIKLTMSETGIIVFSIITRTKSVANTFAEVCRMVNTAGYTSSEIPVRASGQLSSSALLQVAGVYSPSVSTLVPVAITGSAGTAISSVNAVRDYVREL